MCRNQGLSLEVLLPFPLPPLPPPPSKQLMLLSYYEYISSSLSSLQVATLAATILVEETLVVETSMMAAILITLVEETTLATKVVVWEDLEAKETRTQASTINSSSSSRVDLVIKWEGVVVETLETKAMHSAMLAQGLTRAPAVETSTLSLTMDKALAMLDQATEDRCHQE